MNEATFSGRCVPIGCETISAPPENTVDQYRLNILQRGIVRAYTGVGIGESKRKFQLSPMCGSVPGFGAGQSVLRRAINCSRMHRRI